MDVKNRELESLLNLRKNRETVLERKWSGAYRVYKEVERLKNTRGFRGKVFGPLCLEMSPVNENALKYLGILGRSLLNLYVFEDRVDSEKYRNLASRMGVHGAQFYVLRPNVPAKTLDDLKKSHDLVEELPEFIRKVGASGDNSKKKFSFILILSLLLFSYSFYYIYSPIFFFFIGWLWQQFSLSPQLLFGLLEVFPGMQNIVVFPNDIDGSKISKAYNDNPSARISTFVTPSSQYRMSRSLYGNRRVNSSVQNISPSQLLVAGSDPDIQRRLESKLSSLQNKIKSFDQDIQSNRRLGDKIHDEEVILRREKSEISDTGKSRKNIERRISSKEEVLKLQLEEDFDKRQSNLEKSLVHCEAKRFKLLAHSFEIDRMTVTGIDFVVALEVLLHEAEQEQKLIKEKTKEVKELQSIVTHWLHLYLSFHHLLLLLLLLLLPLLVQAISTLNSPFQLRIC